MKRESTAPPRLDSIQAARGIAALLVIAFHCSMAIFSHRDYWPRDPMHHLFAWGHQGVELFFVISGFIILQAHWRYVGRASQLATYAKKRFLRIYPVYWVILAGLIPIYLVEPRFGSPDELAPLTLLSSLSLVHLGTASVVLAVSWTLFFEVLFYAVFAVLILDARAGAVVFACWSALGIAGIALGHPGVLGLYPFAPFSLLFGFGMVAAVLYRRHAIAAPAALAGIGTALFVLNGLLETYRPTFPPGVVTLLAGLFAAIGLSGFAELERRGRIRVARPVQVLGDASYSLYLVHLPVLSLAAKTLLRPMLRVIPPLAAELVMIGIAVAVGIAFHVAIERPMLAFFSRGRTKVAPALLDGPVAS